MYQLIFDIGSNATKASLVNAQKQFIQDWRVSTKLGKNILADGSIDIDIINFNIHAIKTIIEEINSKYKIDISHHCIGTEALRKATNQPQILDLFAENGLILDILSPEEEAKYERIAIMHSQTVKSLPKVPFLLIDSGGSSTECSLIHPDNDVPFAHSFPFGQHKILQHIQNNKENNIFNEFLETLHNIIQQYPIQHIVAAGSSFTTYAMETLKISNPNDVEGKRVTPELSVEIPASRAGLQLVNRLTEACHVPIYVSTYGIRHGWIFDQP